MKTKRNVVILTLIAVTLVVRAQPADTLHFSVEEAVQYALLNNLNAENSRLDIESAKKRVWETAASGLPRVDASVNYNYNISLATTLIPDFFNDPSQKIEIQFGTKHFATAGVTASQLIFSGQYIVGLQTAKIFKEFTETSNEKTEQQIRETITQNYYLVLLGESTLVTLRENAENFRKTFEETREQFRVGFVEEIDVDQLELTLTDLENSVLAMKRQVVASRNLLKYQMGMDRTVPIGLTNSLEELVADIEFEQLLTEEFNLQDNIDYRILKQQETLAMMDMKLKKTDYLPTLSGFFSTDFTAQRDELNLFSADESWYQASVVGLSLSIPIFSSGLRSAGVAQKRIAYEQAMNSRKFAAEGLKVEFQQAQYDFANALEQYRKEQKNLELSRKLIRVTESKYEEGLVSSLELTQVNDQYLRTLSNYTSAMVELLNAKISINLLVNNF
jgi:outer membrane protein TolC